MIYVFALPYLVVDRLHQAVINARRRDRTWRYFAWTALSALTAAALLSFGGALVLVLWAAGLWPLGVVAIAGMMVPVLASWLARHAVVPLGLYRLAYYLGRASRPGADSEAYGLCLAAWAHAVVPRPGGEPWLERRRDARAPLGDAEVVVTALVHAGRGDADAARELMRSAAMLIENHPAVRELAGEWLAVDAAARAAWGELADDAAAARWPASPLSYLLEGIAQCRCSAAGAPGALELRARWLLAPHRRATRPLVAAAAEPTAPAAGTIQSHEPVSTAEPAGSASAAEPPPLARAVAAHLALTAGAADATALTAAVRAWDAALADAATLTWLARRALELDATEGAVARALREVTTAVSDELARAADHARLAAPASAGAVGGELARRLRHGRLDSLEAGFTRWAQRRHDGQVFPAIDEWRQFVSLHTAYTAAVTAGGTELRRLAFPHAFSTGSSMAAWLWNSRNEYALSHAISRWLLDEALAVGDSEAIELGHRNCGLAVPTRVG